MNPAGPQAARIDDLGRLMTWLGGVVFILVLGFLLYSLWRGHGRAEIATGEAVDRRIAWWVGGAVAVTFVIVVFVLLQSFWTGRQISRFSGPGALTVKITGHQWWWEVEYPDSLPSRTVHTANEIHIPIGRRVKIQVASADVIHSFWIPQLAGKIDLIPGYTATRYLRADREGVYSGRCAEFCGVQHAHMGVQVIAESPARFAAWYEAQLRPAAPPSNPAEAAGQAVFVSHQCAFCHTVRGTDAGGNLGPELTHLASRGTLAAVTIPNTRGHLAGWVLDAQGIKPGVKMPPNPLTSRELRSLLVYLESLR